MPLPPARVAKRSMKRGLQGPHAQGLSRACQRLGHIKENSLNEPVRQQCACLTSFTPDGD